MRKAASGLRNRRKLLVPVWRTFSALRKATRKRLLDIGRLQVQFYPNGRIAVRSMVELQRGKRARIVLEAGDGTPAHERLGLIVELVDKSVKRSSILQLAEGVGRRRPIGAY